MNESLTSKTFHGLKWSYLSTIVNVVLQIGFTAIMARLLEPAAFGLIAMAGVVLRFGSYFAQMGVAQALIQKKDVSNEDIRAAFTSALFLGVLFFGLFWIAAPLAVYVFNNEEVIPVLRLMALSFVLTGLSTTALSLLRRNMEFRTLAIIEISSYVVGYGGIGIPLAYTGLGVWSLVIAALSQSGLTAIFSYLFSRHSISFIYQWAYYRPLYSFGSLISVTSFCQFISSNLDTIAIGHFMGSYQLGIYNRAYMLVSLPSQYIFTSLSKVLFSSFSKIQKDVPQVRKLYLSSLTLLWLILIPLTFGMLPAATEIIKMILGLKWIVATPIFQILLITTIFSASTNLAGVIMQSIGRLRLMLLLEVLYLCLLIIALTAVVKFGLIGFAVAVASGSVLRGLGYLYYMSRIFNIRPSHYLKVYFINMMASFLVFVGVFFIRHIFHNVPTVLLLFLEILAGLCMYYLANMFIIGRYFREEIQDLLERLESCVKADGFSRKLILFYRNKVVFG